MQSCFTEETACRLGRRHHLGLCLGLIFHGVDVLEQSLILVEQGAQVIMLGTGDPKLEAFLSVAITPCLNSEFFRHWPSNHWVQILLMPSRFEPCGLTSSMRFDMEQYPLFTPPEG